MIPALGTLAPQQKARLAEILFNKFRPELIRRFHSVTVWDEQDMLDRLIELTKIEKDIAGWQAVGTPAPADRVWRYYSFNPLTDKDKVHPRVLERFRTATLPKGMDKWTMPGFDDSKWQAGHTPIGIGVYKAFGHGGMWTAKPNFFFKNNSAWGDGEFLLMRTTFDVKDLDDDYYRLNILTARGYTVYLNGHAIRSYPWTSQYPTYAKILLTGPVKKYLKKGTNTLAVYGNDRIREGPGDRQVSSHRTVGHLH